MLSTAYIGTVWRAGLGTVNAQHGLHWYCFDGKFGYGLCSTRLTLARFGGQVWVLSMLNTTYIGTVWRAGLGTVYAQHDLHWHGLEGRFGYSLCSTLLTMVLFLGDCKIFEFRLSMRVLLLLLSSSSSSSSSSSPSSSSLSSPL